MLFFLAWGLPYLTEYALQRAKHEFHKNKSVSDPAVVSSLIQKAQINLDIVKRQVLVGQMYAEGHLIIETSPKHESV